MIISIIATFILTNYLDRQAKMHKSDLIKAESLHYKTDLYTNAGIINIINCYKILELLYFRPYNISYNIYLYLL